VSKHLCFSLASIEIHLGVKLQVLHVQVMHYIHIHLKQKSQKVPVLFMCLPNSQLNEERRKEAVCNFFLELLNPKTMQRYIIINLHGFSCKGLVILTKLGFPHKVLVKKRQLKMSRKCAQRELRSM
jgi:hypothetical protein